MQKDVLLEVENLHVYYGVIHAVKGISFKVLKGSIVTIIGANGAGKTSTLKAIMNLIRQKKGKVLYKGKDISKEGTHNIVKMGLTLVPEGRHVFPNLTVLENLLLGAYLRKDDEIEKDLEYVYYLFPRLKERKHQKAGTLSGGEQQMLAIARALMSRPECIMMDEPSLGLAPIIVKQIFDIIVKLKEEGKTILLVEQNAFQALKVSDYAYVMETGKIVLEGKSKDLLNDKRVKEAYLG
ncbi:MAG TPA: ABC transporter ATP-binding protein [Desulfurobacteriaceae bacterium]|nr:ABC transporter ATP-binding protein [Desulfurobacteriaceae bacterium]